RWWLDYLAALQMLLLEHHWGDFCAVFKARKAFKRWRHEYDFDRQKIQNSRLVQDEEILSPYSILWKYYAKGKKKYSEI
ncbi:MAG: glycosyltransferase family 2 protein, partial [Prevotella buccalis]|nr:glycosyltransferase family 2 protein [Hoylesella buccalis]